MIKPNKLAGSDKFITPDWPAPANIVAAVSLSQCGVSEPPYYANMALHVGDNSRTVEANRRALLGALGVKRCSWLEQVHGINVVAAKSDMQVADAVYTSEPGLACAVLTADCLPILLCNRNGTEVAALHCGWRGLAAGIIGQTLDSLSSHPDQILAWLGPAIGPKQFEVGQDVVDAFADQRWFDAACFQAVASDKYLADIYGLAVSALHHGGISSIYGGGFCTVDQPDKFFSYRREPITGRMAAVIFIR